MIAIKQYRMHGHTKLKKTIVLACLLMASTSSSAIARTNDSTEQDSLVRSIDATLVASWSRAGVRPAPRSDDAEFLRRVTLDLAGRIPTVSEVRTFLADETADKRDRLVDRLLAEPGYPVQFSRVWRDRWLPQSAAQFEELRPEFENWLQQRLRANTPYDRMVRELLCATESKAGRSNSQDHQQSGYLFLQANEFKPANLAGSTARIFLGVNIECAQCHDHPRASWTRRQFWEFAAFFADPTASGRHHLELTIPGLNEKATPHFIGGGSPTWKGQPDAITSRATLADWMTSPENPYFACNAVNQVWTYLLGAGLVDSLDDANAATVPGHRQILDQAARFFSRSGYDLKVLLRVLVRTRVYQLSSAGVGQGEAESQGQPLFQQAGLRTQSGEQLFDSILLAAGMDAATAPSSLKTDFLSRFRLGDRPIDAETTILQALTRMNGPLVATAADPEQGRTVTAATDAPFLNAQQRLESLYLATLSRMPRSDELKRMLPMIERCATANERRRALGMIFWALLNSHEFAVIH